MGTKIRHLLDVERVEHQFHEGAHAIQVHVVPIAAAVSVAGVE
jgi:hypothetical protein